MDKSSYEWFKTNITRLKDKTTKIIIWRLFFDMVKNYNLRS